MAGMAPEGSQFDAKQYDAKMQDLLNQGETEEFFTSYDEVYESFDDMGLQENLLRGIYAYGFEKPSAIQQRGIVPFCKGLDVIQQAQSGTGKTATFCSGILQQLDYGLVECQALVLAPTRELAQQIEKVMRALGDYLGVKVHACVGGTSVHEDQRILASGVHVVVGTPGRVFDMLRRQSLRPDNIRMFVLDEADEMLSRGFKDQIYDIFQLLPMKIQVGVFSATMPLEALEITHKFMNKPVRILVKRDELPRAPLRDFLPRGEMTSHDGAAEGVAVLGISGSDEWAAVCAPLQRNLELLSPDEVLLAKILLSEGQMHLFEHWSEPGIDDDKKRSFFDQVRRLNSNYPGGLASYIQNARKLLADSKAGKNPFDGFTPSVPSGEVLTFGDDRFVSFEATGVKEARNAAFVLVAGGLGERLGYKGIKVALPRETTTGKCFLQHYIESILALQEASCKTVEGECHDRVPFVIMTSDDTNALTIKLLESNSYFGMEPSQLKILKQEKVACLADNDARLALDPNDKYKIQTKPHGHGDVHALLYSSGLLEQWKNAGRKWVLFFQDTNGLLFKAIPAALGVSATRGYNVNSLTVPRKAKEAIGGITKLTHDDGRTMVINVEYNQLDPLLRATRHPDGDVNDETGYSPYPGNINQLILELGPYIEELEKTHGGISEFVNPKYTDSTKTAFKSSTRLECMMQDYPKTLPPSAKVGFTVMDTWLAYAPVKNNPEDAAKVPKGNPYHSATSGEMAIYRANSLILRKAGVKIADPIIHTFNGQEVEVWPRITWSPRWGLTFKDVKDKVDDKSSVSQSSAFVINGQNITVESLSLDGTLVVNAVDEAEVEVTGRIQNKGWILRHVDRKNTSAAEEIRIRGFTFEKVEQLEANYTESGKHCLGG